MKYSYIIFSIIVGLLACCEKKTPITKVNGIVINAGTKQPVAGALVEMQDGVGNNTSGLFSGSSNVGTGATQQITTGVDGTFSFSFPGEAPVIWVEKAQYDFFNPNGAEEIYLMTAGKVYANLQLKLVAYAWFNPILKGHNCISTDSVLVLGTRAYLPRGKGGGGYTNYFGNGPNKFGYSGEGLLAAGDFYCPYGIQWQEHGVWQPGRIDSVYIKSFTTYTDTIYY